MHTDSLLGTTVRDLVFLVQDSGCQADAAEEQLLKSHAMLINAAARLFPTLRSADEIAQQAFMDAVRTLKFSRTHSIAGHCWAAMSTALVAAKAAKNEPQQLPLLTNSIAVPIRSADLQRLHRISAANDARARAHYRLIA